ncbi:transketolase C-terminal domain-containing protein [Candidatus Contubernalis alkaliaceticus]|uniref:transketolase C-terminal domain-containing protein n=1 Tax=Candidatus Contubernalis alkaliaceticus TaxID=338645 RepID=UPI001F4C154B|nr:transketolase C-terminal domain-containing protein [Candidatus Contubernalis alkalaceticus]UNC91379.1 pyruvate ferredoxin oxidoreductase [Candidatus Contubernalis alkalaceticus]
MAKRVGMEVSIAAAEAVKQADVDVVAAYPITPQTHIVEKLSEFVANGQLDAEYVTVESEHSAMSVAIGSQASGARTFTSTSSQGLALMSELVPIASALRLPMVMLLVNRSLSGPLSIWNDHSDVMSIRDSGCIQLFVKNGQEVYDHVFIAYRIAEKHNVLLPVIINMDGFILSHTFESVELMEDHELKGYIPPYVPAATLHPDKPLTMGAYATPALYTEAKKAHDEVLKASQPAIVEAWEAWTRLTGRHYHPVEELYCQDADTILVSMGSLSETAAEAVKLMRKQGQKVGLLELRMWRPFPFEEFSRAAAGAKKLVVMDRAVSSGGPGGPVASEIRSALYGIKNPPQVDSYIIGLGGRNVTIEDYVQMIKGKKTDCIPGIYPGSGSNYEIFGARG